MRAFLPYRQRTPEGFSSPWAHIWDGQKADIYPPLEWKPKNVVEVQISGDVPWRGYLPIEPGTKSDVYVVDFSGISDEVMQGMLSAWVWFV